MDDLDGMAANDLGPTLGVQDTHPEEEFDKEMEQSAGESTVLRLEMMHDGSRNPAGGDGTGNRGCFQRTHQVVEGFGRCCAVGIYVADEVRQGRQLESFNEGPSFADGTGKFTVCDAGMTLFSLLNHSQGVVSTPIEHDDQTKLAGVMLAEVVGVVFQDGPDTVLLVVGGDEQ